MMRKNAEHIIVILGGPETIFEEEHILALWTDLFLIKGNYNNCNNESLTMLIHFWIKMPSFSSVRQAPGRTAKYWTRMAMAGNDKHTYGLYFKCVMTINYD
jgi:hypothetical protein